MITRIEPTLFRKEQEKGFESGEELGLKERGLIPRVISGLVSLITNPIRQGMRKEMLDARQDMIERFTDCDGFRTFEKRMQKYTGELNRNSFGSVVEYISALLIIDQLECSLQSTNISLSPELKALDVGCGKDWSYAGLLYGFLQNYGTGVPRKVSLDGIDMLANDDMIKMFEKMVGNRNIKLMYGNVLKFEHDGEYDFILMHKMLCSPHLFKRYGVKQISLDDLMAKCSQLLSPKGIQITIGYQAGGEYWDTVEHIPPGKRIAEFNYKVDLGNEILNLEFTPGYDKIYRSGICISVK